MRTKAFTWIFLALLISAPLVAAGADDDVLQRARARGALVVAAAPAPDQLPQAAKDEAGNYVGFDIDVANAIGQRLELPVRFVSPGWDRVLAGDWRGQWDFAVASITPPRRVRRRSFFRLFIASMPQLWWSARMIRRLKDRPTLRERRLAFDREQLLRTIFAATSSSMAIRTSSLT